jgi:Transglutaminase-like superfamily
MPKLATLTAFLLLATSALAQPQPAADRQAEFRSLSDRARQAYQKKDYQSALKAFEQLAAAPELRENRDAQASLGYSKACMHALLGHKQRALELLRAAFASGYMEYASFARDADFDSLRKDTDFKALAVELRAQHGPTPLVFDSTETATEFPIGFDDPGLPEYARLRAEFKVDDAVAGARDDYDRLQRLTLWTSRQWQHDSTHMASKTDPLTILREASQGGRFICMNYAVVLAGAARAYGLTARQLALLPRDVETRSEAHSVVEVWLPQFKKWVLADAQYGIVPELDGKPLSALELQRALASDEERLVCRGAAQGCAAWQAFILRNSYFFKFDNQQRYYSRSDAAPAKLVLVPKGAPPPRKFAGGNEQVFANSTYTSNPAAFYAPPRP